MIGQRRPSECVRYLRSGVRAGDEDVIQRPVAVVGSIVLWLPPAHTHSFLTSSRGQQHVHKPEHRTESYRRSSFISCELSPRAAFRND